jgi:hypothetical protein
VNAMSSIDLESVEIGASRLRSYLVILIVSMLIVIAINTYTTLSLEKYTRDLKPIDAMGLYANVILTIVFWIIPQVVYYTATRSLAKWSEKFTPYMQLASAFIAILLLQRVIGAYQLYRAINEYNNSLAQLRVAQVDLVSIYGLTTIYDFVAGGVFTVILVGVLNVIAREGARTLSSVERSEGEHGSVEEPCGVFCKLNEGVTYLRIAQAHFIMGGIFLFMHAEARIPGLVIMLFGLTFLVNGSIKSALRVGVLLEKMRPPSTE